MSEKNEKQRVICTKCGYAEFQTILRPMFSKEIRVMEWDALGGRNLK